MKWKNLKLKMLNKNNLLFWNKKKLMKLKKIKLIYPQRNIKMTKMAHQLPQQKNILTQLIKKRNQVKMCLRKPTHLLSPQKTKIDTVEKKQRNHKHPQKQLIPSKIIKNDTVDRADKSRSIPVTNLSNKCTQI